MASGTVISPRASPSSRMRFAIVQAPNVPVTPMGSTMKTAPSPSVYTSPGPPMKANPDSVAAIAAMAIVQRPIPCPATKKSLALLVRRVAQTPIAATTTKYATATPTMTGCASGGSAAVCSSNGSGTTPVTDPVPSASRARGPGRPRSASSGRT